MSDYIPISCNYYDELEALAVKRKTVKVVYNFENEVREIDSKLLNFYIRDHIEYALLEDDLEIRMDHLISADGKFLKDYS